MICSVCKERGTEVFSRCGHILHEKCYRKSKTCKKCKQILSENVKDEKVFIKLLSSDLSDFEKKKLEKCLESFKKQKVSDKKSNVILKDYDENILENLQRFGWDINDKYFGGINLFYQACKLDDILKLDLLIDHGIDLQKYGKKGLNRACSNSSIKAFDRLIKLGIELNPKIIFKIISRKRIKMISHVVKEGIDINFIGNKGKRPIHAAAEIGSIEMIKALIENGADFMVVDDEGNSILHYACLCINAKRLLTYFLESGFDFRIKNIKSLTPLMFAIKEHKYSNACFLIKHKAGLDVCDRYGNTPLHACCSGNHLKEIKALLSVGVDINARNSENQTPLHVVDDWKPEEIIKILLKNGAEMNVLDDFNKSPLYYFHKNISKELKGVFIDGGADLTIKNSSGESILDLMLKLNDNF